MWELLSAEQRTLVFTRTEELRTGSIWLFYVRVSQHGGSAGVLWVLMTLRVLTHIRILSFPFLPQPSLPSHSALSLTAVSPLYIPEVPPNCPIS